jgi:hypothetical protein
MIIADLIDPNDKSWKGRAYLADTPFPGDTVSTPGGSYLVIRRRFLDLGPDQGSTNDRLSTELVVRPL